ncbi:hypothetical protein BH23VER1_BH23VER1_33010 [soil metagenome]
MATMTHRTTFALDEGTAHRIRSLAKLWNVSQAEVVRRAVASAGLASAQPDPVAMLEQLHSSGHGLEPSVAEGYLTEVRDDRKRWRS